MKATLTEKGKAVIKYFLLNGNTPTYQKIIAENAGISEQYLGTGGLLAKLEEEGILGWIRSKVRQRGTTKHYFLKEDRATFQKIAHEFLKDNDIAPMFIQSEYTQKLIKEYVLDMVSKNFSIDLSQDGNTENLIKKILKKSPSVLKSVLTDRPKKEIDEKKSLFGKFLFGRSWGNGIDTLAFFSILLYADVAKYQDLAQTAEDIRMSIENFEFDLRLEVRKRLEEDLDKAVSEGKEYIPPGSSVVILK